jgi:hypothetical protein
MAVALIDSRVGREEVKIHFAVDIPYMSAAASLQYHGDRVIVVRSIALFQFHELLRAGYSSISGHTFLDFVSENRINR